MKNEHNPFVNLPTEIILKIAGLLTLKSRIALSEVCAKLEQISKNRGYWDTYLDTAPTALENKDFSAWIKRQYELGKIFGADKHCGIPWLLGAISAGLTVNTKNEQQDPANCLRLKDKQLRKSFVSTYQPAYSSEIIQTLLEATPKRESRINPIPLQYLPDTVKKDERALLTSVEINGSSLQYAADSLKDNEKIVKTAMRNNPRAFSHASERLRDTEAIATIAVQGYNYKDALNDVSLRLRNDRKFVLTAVTANGLSIEYAPKKFQEDKEIQLAALKAGGSAHNVSKTLLSDKNIFLIACKSNHFNDASIGIPETLMKDDAVILKALSENGEFLQYAPEKFKKDESAVLLAVTSWGTSLEYASKELRNNKKIVLAAVNSSGYALQYASQGLQNDEHIVFTAVNNRGAALMFASKTLQNNKKIVLAAVTTAGLALSYASAELRNNKEVVLAAVNQAGCFVLQYASNELQHSEEIVLATIEKNAQNADLAHIIPAKLLKKSHIARQVLKKDGRSLRKVLDILRYNGTVTDEIRETVRTAVEQNPTALEFAPESLQDRRAWGA